MYIYRELQNNLVRQLRRPSPQGVILTGMVGCGKTRLLEEILSQLDGEFAVFRFTGDDLRFREAVASDTRYLLNFVTARTQQRALIFVDEVQKTEAVFDALKLAFDGANASFVVSGSNPDFLTTRAKFHLQRRADVVFLQPFSISEILSHHKLVSTDLAPCFRQIIFEWEHIRNSFPKIDSKADFAKIIQDYLIYGGLPLSYLAQSPEEKLLEIRKTVERGFEQMSCENDSISELIRIELGKLHAREFAYQGIFQRTRLRRREKVNETIDQLINHGYLSRRTPMQFDRNRKTYLSILSFVDPGIVTYITGELNPTPTELGLRAEGVVQSRLSFLFKNEILKTELGYYKPFKRDSHGNIRYLPGEIDFVVKRGKRVVPIEVKLGMDKGVFDLSAINALQKQVKHIPFGVVLYGGLPSIDENENVIYWPWWGV